MCLRVAWLTQNDAVTRIRVKVTIYPLAYHHPCVRISAREPTRIELKSRRGTR